MVSWFDFRRTFKVFRLHWRTFLTIHITANVFSALILTPLLTLVLGWLVLISGQVALTDEDILFFALSSKGLPIFLLAAGLLTTVVVFQQAAMITASQWIALGKTVSLRKLGVFLLLKFWPLLQLSLHMIGRTILLVSPFLAIIALVYFSFLSKYDINYYLIVRPPVFWQAGGLILMCLLLMTGVLLRVFAGWILALPLLLLGNETPTRVMKKSRKTSVSMRAPILLSLLAIFLLNTGLLGLLSSLSDMGVDGAVALAGDSMQMMAYLLGSLSILWLIASVTIAFLSNLALTVVIFTTYTRFMGVSDDKLTWELLTAERPGGIWNMSATRFAGLALLISLVAGLTLSMLINRLNPEDNTQIIAHRGASADAPENTLAAMELAIQQGADWVEIDVQETAEGEVVVIHDSDLKKVGGTGLRVFQTPLEELQSVDIGSWMDPAFSDQRVPTLQQVLALCKNRINIVIELKYYGQERSFEQSVADIVDTAGMSSQIVVMSLNYTGVQTMKSIRPTWKIGLLSSVAMGDVTRLEADFLAINANFATRSFIRRAHNRDKKVLVWTVNDPVSMSAMMSKGVDGLITDKPLLASKILKERAELGMHERMMIQLASFIGRQPERPEQ